MIMRLRHPPFYSRNSLSVSGMVPHDNPDDNFLFEAIGRMVVTWSHLEFTIDVMILIIHNVLGRSDIEPKKPRSLDRKLSYLSDFFKSLPLDDVALAGYRRLISDIKIAAIERHDIIHGVSVRHVEGSGEISMVRLLHRDQGFDKKHVVANLETIGAAIIKANLLAKQVFHWVEEFDSFIQEQKRLGVLQTP